MKVLFPQSCILKIRSPLCSKADLSKQKSNHHYHKSLKDQVRIHRTDSGAACLFHCAWPITPLSPSAPSLPNCWTLPTHQAPSHLRHVIPVPPSLLPFSLPASFFSVLLNLVTSSSFLAVRGAMDYCSGKKKSFWQRVLIPKEKARVCPWSLLSLTHVPFSCLESRQEIWKHSSHLAIPRGEREHERQHAENDEAERWKEPGFLMPSLSCCANPGLASPGLRMEL